MISQKARIKITDDDRLQHVLVEPLGPAVEERRQVEALDAGGLEALPRTSPVSSGISPNTPVTVAPSSVARRLG